MSMCGCWNPSNKASPVSKTCHTKSFGARLTGAEPFGASDDNTDMNNFGAFLSGAELRGQI
jgi:hypothetical protein